MGRDERRERPVSSDEEMKPIQRRKVEDKPKAKLDVSSQVRKDRPEEDKRGKPDKLNADDDKIARREKDRNEDLKDKDKAKREAEMRDKRSNKDDKVRDK